MSFLSREGRRSQSHRGQPSWSPSLERGGSSSGTYPGAMQRSVCMPPSKFFSCLVVQSVCIFCDLSILPNQERQQGLHGRLRMSLKEREKFMENNFDPSRIDQILAKVKDGCSQSATYAVTLFKSFFQSETASRLRPDVLQQLIVESVEKNPAITWKELLRELEQHEHDGGVITSITDDVIEWVEPDGPVRSAKISGLKDRLGRARKSLKSGDSR